MIEFLSGANIWKLLSFALMGILASNALVPGAYAISDSEVKKKFQEIWTALINFIASTEEFKKTATEEIDALITRTDALEARVEEESSETSEAIGEVLARLEEAEDGLESKADQEDVNNLGVQIADLSDQLAALEKRVTELEGGPVDADGDGVFTPLDCDDSNPAIYPGAVEVANGIDDNCDGAIDEGTVGDGVVTSGIVNLAIPDDGHPGTVASSSLSFPDSGVINDVNVEVSVSHTWIGDLVIELESPSGTRVTLMSDAGGDDSSNLHASFPITFDDEASLTVAQMGNLPVGAEIGGSGVVCEDDGLLFCEFQPNQALSGFDTEDPSGTWTLRVGDVTGGDIGTLAQWSLAIDFTP